LPSSGQYDQGTSPCAGQGRRDTPGPPDFPQATEDAIRAGLAKPGRPGGAQDRLSIRCRSVHRPAHQSPSGSAFLTPRPPTDDNRVAVAATWGLKFGWSPARPQLHPGSLSATGPALQVLIFFVALQAPTRAFDRPEKPFVGRGEFPRPGIGCLRRCFDSLTKSRGDGPQSPLWPRGQNIQ
jgi:hypothetical protein